MEFLIETLIEKVQLVVTEKLEVEYRYKLIFFGVFGVFELTRIQCRERNRQPLKALVCWNLKHVKGDFGGTIQDSGQGERGVWASKIKNRKHFWKNLTITVLCKRKKEKYSVTWFATCVKFLIGTFMQEIKPAVTEKVKANHRYKLS